MARSFFGSAAKLFFGQIEFLTERRAAERSDLGTRGGAAAVLRCSAARIDNMKRGLPQQGICKKKRATRTISDKLSAITIRALRAGPQTQQSILQKVRGRGLCAPGVCGSDKQALAFIETACQVLEVSPHLSIEPVFYCLHLVSVGSLVHAYFCVILSLRLTIICMRAPVPWPCSGRLRDSTYEQRRVQ